MVQLACKHGTSLPMTPSEALNFEIPEKAFDVFVAALLAVESFELSSRRNEGDHLRAWLFNWGTPEEFAITNGDDGVMLKWSRCAERERAMSGNRALWVFHKSISLHDWAEYHIRQATENDLF